MLLFWRIRYFDRVEHSFKDRDLWLDTCTLPPATKAAVELALETADDNPSKREFLKFRPLFGEDQSQSFQKRVLTFGGMKSFFLPDYFEDELGNEVSFRDLGALITGDPSVVFLPSHFTQKDIDYLDGEAKPIPLAEVTLTTEQVKVLGYFSRDLEELIDSALMRDGPGTISSGGLLPRLPNDDLHLKTAISDEEIRSFVTIFRRLYMKKEPANLAKAVEVFCEVLGDHRLAKWVRETKDGYLLHLDSPPDAYPTGPNGPPTFKVKLLIDVFLYTQYSHQPDENRQNQFMDCLQQLGNRRNLLMSMFLTEIWKCGLEMHNAGKPISDWFKRYCDHHNLKPDVLNSVRHEHEGLGTDEKKDAKRVRLFREKCEELSVELWKESGCPAGGPTQFFLEAEQRLNSEIKSAE